MKPEELDIVRLVHPLQEHDLPAGAEGAVVMDYTQYSPEAAPASYEVEFTNDDHETLAVATVREEDLQVINRGGLSSPTAAAEELKSLDGSGHTPKPGGPPR